MVQLDFSASYMYVLSDKCCSSAVIGLNGIAIANVDLALTCKVKVTCSREIEVTKLGSVVSSAVYMCKESLQQEMNAFCSQ
jgi:hypothetical protein